MTKTRSSESCLIVSVSPVPPNRTSWCATSPATRTEWTCTSSTTAPRAPGRDDTVASGGASRPAAVRAAPITDAVRRAVPDGASALPARCNSMTSADSKNLAACSAKRIITLAQPLPHLVQPVFGEPRCPDHHVQIVRYAPAQVLHDHAGMREVDDHVASGQRVEVVALVDLGHDVQVRALPHHADHLTPHPPPRPQHPDLRHRCPPGGFDDRVSSPPLEGR